MDGGRGSVIKSHFWGRSSVLLRRTAHCGIFLWGWRLWTRLSANPRVISDTRWRRTRSQGRVLVAKARGPAPCVH